MTTTQTIISIVGLFLAGCLGVIGTLILVNLTTLREEIRNISIDVTKLKESKVSTSTLEDKFTILIGKLETLNETQSDIKKDVYELKTSVTKIDKNVALLQKDVDYLTKEISK